MIIATLKHKTAEMALAHRAVPAPVASSSFPPAGRLPHLGIRPRGAWRAAFRFAGIPGIPRSGKFPPS